MSDQGVVRGTRQRSNSESGHPRLNSTSIDNELVFNDSDLSNTWNNLSRLFINLSKLFPVTFLKAILNHLCGLELGPDFKLESCQLIVIKKLLF